MKINKFKLLNSFLVSIIIVDLLISPFRFTFGEPGFLENLKSPSLEKGLGQKFGLIGFEIGVLGSTALEAVWGEFINRFVSKVLDKLGSAVANAVCDALDAAKSIPVIGSLFGAGKGALCGDAAAEQVKQQVQTNRKIFKLITETMRNNFQSMTTDFYKSYLQARLSRETGKILELQKINNKDEYLAKAELRGKILGLRDYLKSFNCLLPDVKTRLLEDAYLGDTLKKLKIFNYFSDFIKDNNNIPTCDSKEGVIRDTYVITQGALSMMIEGGRKQRELEESQIVGDFAPKIKCEEEINLDTGEPFCLQYTVEIDAKTFADSAQETQRNTNEKTSSAESPQNLLSFLGNLDALSTLSMITMGYKGLTKGQDLNQFLKDYYQNFNKQVDKACEIYKKLPNEVEESSGKGIIGDVMKGITGAITSFLGGNKTPEYFLCKVLLKKQLVFMLEGRNVVDTAITRLLNMTVLNANNLTKAINTTTKRIKEIGDKIFGTSSTSTASLPSYLVIAKLAQEGRTDEIGAPPEVIDKYLEAVRLHEENFVDHQNNLNMLNNFRERIENDVYEKNLKETAKEMLPHEREMEDALQRRNEIGADVTEKMNDLTKRMTQNIQLITQYEPNFDDGSITGLNWPSLHQFPETECGGKHFGNDNLCPGESVSEGGGGGGHAEVSLHVCKDQKAVRGRYGGGGDGTPQSPIDCAKDSNGETESCGRATVVTRIDPGGDANECAALACIHTKDEFWFGANYYNGKRFYDLDPGIVRKICGYLGLSVPGNVGCSQVRPDIEEPPEEYKDWGYILDVDGNIVKAKEDDIVGDITNCKFIKMKNIHINNCCEISFKPFYKVFAFFDKFIYNLTLIKKTSAIGEFDRDFGEGQGVENIRRDVENIPRTTSLENIDIIQPRNGETLRIGDEIEIKWRVNASDYSKFAVTEIVLKNKDTGITQILGNIKAPRDNSITSFRWTAGKDRFGNWKVFPGNYRLSVVIIKFGGMSINALSDFVDIRIEGELPIKKPIIFNYPEKQIQKDECDWARIYNPNWLSRTKVKWIRGDPIADMCVASGGGGGGGGGGSGGGGGGGSGGGGGEGGGRNGGGGGQPPTYMRPKNLKESLLSFVKSIFGFSVNAQSNQQIDIKVNGSDGPLTLPASTTVDVSWDASILDNNWNCRVKIYDDAGAYDPQWSTNKVAGAQHHIYEYRDKIGFGTINKVKIKKITYKLECKKEIIGTFPKVYVTKEDHVDVYVGSQSSAGGGRQPAPGNDLNEDIITSLRRFLQMLGGPDPNKITEDAKRRYITQGTPSNTMSSCGDGICQASQGENVETCPEDCTGYRGQDENEREPYMYMRQRDLKDTFWGFLRKLFVPKTIAQSNNPCLNCAYNKGQRRFLFDIVNMAYMDFRPHRDYGEGSFLSWLNGYLGESATKLTTEGEEEFPLPRPKPQISKASLAEIKAYLSLKLDIVKALLKYNSKFSSHLDLALGSKPGVRASVFLEDYKRILENLIAMINIHLEGNFDEKIEEFRRLDKRTVELSQRFEEVQDEVLPKTVENFAKNDVPVYTADLRKIEDRMDDIERRNQKVNSLLDEVESDLNKLAYQRKKNEYFAKRKINENISQNVNNIITLPKLIKSIFSPKIIEIKGTR
jgi:hypothetical protein